MTVPRSCVAIALLPLVCALGCGSAGAGGLRDAPAGPDQPASVELDGARLLVPAGTVDRDTTIRVRRTAGKDVPGAFEFDVGEARLLAAVTVEVPVAKGSADATPVLAFRDSRDGVWHVEPAEYDRSRGVLVAQTTHLSTWGPIDLRSALLQPVATMARTSLQPGTSPSCDPPDDIEIDGLAPDPLIHVCPFRAVDGSIRLELVNPQPYPLVLHLSGVTVTSDFATGTAVERAMRQARGASRRTYLPAGTAGQAIVRGTRASIRAEPDLAAAAVGVGAHVGSQLFPGGRAVAIGGSLVDCVTHRGVPMASWTGVVRTGLDCLVAAAGIAPSLGTHGARFAAHVAVAVPAALVGTVTAALDTEALAEATVDTIRTDGSGTEVRITLRNPFAPWSRQVVPSPLPRRTDDPVIVCPPVPCGA